MKKIVDILYLLPPELLPYDETCFNYHNDLNTNDFLNSVFEHKNTINLTRKILIKLLPLTLEFDLLHSDPKETQQNRDNDEAFNIKRVRGNTSTVLTISVLQAYYLMLENVQNCGCSLSSADWDLLNYTFLTLLKLYNGLETPLEHQTIPVYLSNHSEFKKDDQSYERWVCGHYIFMIIVQGLVISLNIFTKNIENNNVLGINKYLNLAILLFKVTEISFKFTGEFSMEGYNESVRPTLMPPIAKPEMSGLHWRDHQYMIKTCFQPLRTSFTKISENFPSLVDEFYQVLSNVYKTHGLVCSKFVGTAQPSLRSTDSAVTVLEKFRKSRLSLIKQKEAI